MLALDSIRSGFDSPKPDCLLNWEPIDGLNIVPDQGILQRSLDYLKGKLPNVIDQFGGPLRQFIGAAHDPDRAFDRFFGDTIASLEDREGSLNR